MLTCMCVCVLFVLALNRAQMEQHYPSANIRGHCGELIDSFLEKKVCACFLCIVRLLYSGGNVRTFNSISQVMYVRFYFKLYACVSLGVQLQLTCCFVSYK